MALNKNQIVDLYRRRAKHYNFTANLYYLIGFREWTYRKKAVQALSLKPGDTVVEIGCGTGLNFSLLEAAVGKEGRIVGVDMTDSMLAVAKNTVRRNQWPNVQLVHSDATKFSFPQSLQGVLSTFAITLVPDYDSVIRAASETLAPEGRLVILDFKMPSNWLRWFTPLMALITRPFAVTLDLASRHPWEAMGKYFANVSMKDCLGGMVYIAVGEESKFQPEVRSPRQESSLEVR